MELVDGTLYVSKKEMAEGMHSSISTIEMYLGNADTHKFCKTQKLDDMAYRGVTYAITPDSISAMEEHMGKRNKFTCNKFISWIEKMVDCRDGSCYKREQIKQTQKRVQLSLCPEIIPDKEFDYE